MKILFSPSETKFKGGETKKINKNSFIFPELFEEYGEFLRGSKKNILLVNGVIVWDKFRGEYILQANVNSLFTVLT